MRPRWLLFLFATIATLAVLMAAKSTHELTLLSREHHRLVKKIGDFEGSRQDTLWIAPCHRAFGPELSWHIHNPNSCSLICELQILGKSQFVTLDWFSGSVKTLKLATFQTPQHLGLKFGNGVAWHDTTAELNQFFEKHFEAFDFSASVREFVEVDASKSIVTLMQAKIPAGLEGEYQSLLSGKFENPQGLVFARIRLGTLDSFAAESGAPGHD